MRQPLSLSIWHCAISPKNGRIPRSLGNWRQPNLPFDLVKDSLPWRSEKSETNHCQSPKDKPWALEPLGFNSRLTHNRLFPGRHVAATSRTCTRHSRTAPARGDYGYSVKINPERRETME